MQKGSYYIHCLKERLDAKQRLHPRYSLRAFARDVGIHPSTLSAVLKGARALPLKDAKKVTRKLALSPKEQTLFLESLFRTKARLDDLQIPENEERFMLDESHYKVIAEWEHFAALVLFDTSNFQGNEKEVSERLNITEARAEVVLHHLLSVGLIREDERGVLVKAHAQVRTTEDIQNQALHQGHQDALALGSKKLDEVEVEFRDFSEMAVALDPEKIPEAKTIIREFRQKMAALLRDGNKTEVYQLAIQFYPLTNINPSTTE